MSRAKRIGLSSRYCKCSRVDGEAKLSKRKQAFLRKIRTGVKERVRHKPQKSTKSVITVKKKPGSKPVKHYVNLPGWVVRNLMDICKKKAQGRNLSKLKKSLQESHSMESVKEKSKKERQSQKNMENEQVPAEVMEIKREMATT